MNSWCNGIGPAIAVDAGWLWFEVVGLSFFMRAGFIFFEILCAPLCRSPVPLWFKKIDEPFMKKRKTSLSPIFEQLV